MGLEPVTRPRLGYLRAAVMTAAVIFTIVDTADEVDAEEGKPGSG
jgi:hypothetical protein